MITLKDVTTANMTTTATTVTTISISTATTTNTSRLDCSLHTGNVDLSYDSFNQSTNSSLSARQLAHNCVPRRTTTQQIFCLEGGKVGRGFYVNTDPNRIL